MRLFGDTRGLGAAAHIYLGVLGEKACKTSGGYSGAEVRDDLSDSARIENSPVGAIHGLFQSKIVKIAKAVQLIDPS